MRQNTSSPPCSRSCPAASTATAGACFMEFASVLAGERWSDHPDLHLIPAGRGRPPRQRLHLRRRPLPAG